MNNRTNLCIALTLVIVFAAIGLTPEANADVVGTLSTATDTVITWVRAGLAIIIIYCGIMMIRGGGLGPIIGIIIAAAIMVSARDLAALIQ